MSRSIKIGIFEEAREFNLKLWETPSFLFFIMGIFTVVIMYITYEVSRRLGEPEVIVIAETTVTALTFALGFLLVNGLSKIIITNRANYDFVSLATHELRTPLAAVKWSLRAALDGDFGIPNAELRSLLVKSYESNERMVLLVSDLLSISRIESGRFAYDFSYEDIGELIKETLQDLEFDAKKKNVNISFSLPSDPQLIPKVRIDRVKIKLVLQNIITNAIRYNIPNGRVVITVEPQEGKMGVTIADTGKGIPKDEQAKVFTRFFRARNIAQTVGSGLGLYLSKRIIEKHGGEITFESEENKGTTLHLTLPT